MTTETTPSPRFDDYRNITVGRARVIWAPAWAYLPEAWCLPGGRRTENFSDAHAVDGGGVMKDQPLTDPREIRKLLTEISYRGGRLDGKHDQPSMSSSLVRTIHHLAQHQGLSGEDHMTLLAYHALLGYEKAMDMVLEEAMTRPAARLFVDPSKVGP